MCERDRVKSSQHIFLTVRPRFEKKFQCVGLTPCYFRYVPVRVFENSGDFGEGKNTYVSRFADSAIWLKISWRPTALGDQFREIEVEGNTK